MKIGLVTCARIPELEESERKLLPLLKSYGFDPKVLIWDHPDCRWFEYDCLVIRSIWDYHLKFEQFQKWLDHIDSLGIRVLNPVNIIRKNTYKFYLKELSDKGIPIIPTIFLKSGVTFDYEHLKKQNWKEVIIKPAISASAYKTEKYAITDKRKIEVAISEIQLDSDVLIQKFIPEIQSEGELSIICLNKKYAYTILKEASVDEFRVQAEFGGKSKTVDISEKVKNAALQIVTTYDEDILYARVDGLLINGEFVLMELELTEPSLFFEIESSGPLQFVKEAVQLIHKK